MKDIIFCALPYLDLVEIYSAPAILKGVVQKHGFTATTKDFGIELYKECNYSKELYHKIQHYFISTENQGLSNEEVAILDRFFNNAVSYFKNNPSKYIGISVLSTFTHKATLRLIAALKAASIDSKIIAGGRGLDVSILSTIVKEFNITGINKALTFGQLLQKLNLADIVIHGDGEDAIVDALQNNLNKYNDTILESEMYRWPDPDYTDYELSLYHSDNASITLPITGSKGCVRNCDFCDIPSKFGRYRYRSGNDIAEEMIHLQKKYNVNHFAFTDSLVNGGLRPFKEFLVRIAEFNETTKGHKISWSGQYINRPAGSLDDDYYALLSRAGARALTIGAESGSNYVLESMQKKTTVEGLYYDLEMFRKHGVQCTLLLFVGHWSERPEDFIDHCRMLIKLAPYVRSNTIITMALGYPFLFTDVLPIETRNKSMLADFSKEMIWLHKDNPSNTIKERAYRRIITGEIAKRLNYPTRSNSLVYQLLATTIQNNYQEINNFYNQDQNTKSVAQQHYDNIDQFYYSLLKDIEETIAVKLVIDSSSCNGDPETSIIINGVSCYSGLLSAGNHQFEFKVPGNTSNINISVSLTNKSKHDTIIDNNGNILANKSITLSELTVQNINIVEDLDFFYDHCTYLVGGVETRPPSTTLWDNGSINVNCQLPFIHNYCTKSTKNVHEIPESSRAYSDSLQQLLSALNLLE